MTAAGPAIITRSVATSGIGDQKSVTPGTIVDGDLLSLVAFYLNSNSSATPGNVICTPPAGFISRSKTTYNFVSSGSVTNLQINLEYFTKIAASESGAYTVSMGNNDAGSAAYTNLAIIADSGAHATVPIDKQQSNVGGPSSSSGTVTALSVAPDGSTDKLRWIFAGYDTGCAAPSGMTAQVTDLDGVNQIADLDLVASGATGNKTSTIAGESIQQNGWIALLVALHASGDVAAQAGPPPVLLSRNTLLRM